MACRSSANAVEEWHIEFGRPSGWICCRENRVESARPAPPRNIPSTGRVFARPSDTAISSRATTWLPSPDFAISSTRASASIGSPLAPRRSEEHTSELQSLMRISYAVFCLKKKKHKQKLNPHTHQHTITYRHHSHPTRLHTNTANPH